MKYRWILVAAILYLSVLCAPALLAQNNMVLEANTANDYVDMGKPAQLNFGKGDFTIEAWFRTESDVNDWRTIFDNDTHNVGGTFIGLVRNGIGPNKLWWTVKHQGAETHIESMEPVNDGLWHHFSVVRDGGNMKMFLDSVLQSELDSDQIRDEEIDAENDNAIGRRFTHESATAKLEYDEIRVWNIARTQEDIEATMKTRLTGKENGLIGYWNFDDGTAKDLSSSGNHGELKGDAKIVESDLELAATVEMKGKLPTTFGAVKHNALGQ